MEPDYQNNLIKLFHGNALDVLKHLEDESINCCVTSPPYWGLRDYGIDNQIGLEKTPKEYVENLIKIFREVKRVLRNDGTLWLNIGDSYMSNPKSGDGDPKYINGRSKIDNPNRKKIYGLKAKDLIGIPWRVAFALQADGWYLRQDIIWHKPNPMPESVTDRCTKSHEYIFLLSKSKKYYCNMEAIKEPTITKDNSNRDRDNTRLNNVPGRTRMSGLKTNDYDERNKRSVWIVNTKPYKEAHFAVYPEELIEPCIKAGCPKDGTILDPFSGSGTTMLVTSKQKKKGIAIDLSKIFINISIDRIEQYRTGLTQGEIDSGQKLLFE